jgi:hypothetical protein
MVRCSALGVAFYCGLSAVLGAKHGSGRPAAMGSAFHKYCETGSESALESLDAEEKATVLTWKKPGDVDVAGITLEYVDAKKEVQVAIDAFGDPCEYGDPRAATQGTLDFVWEVDDGQSFGVYVADIKKTQWTAADGPNSLQVMAYGLLYALLVGADWFCTGIWTATEGEWSWSKAVIHRDSPAWNELMSRVLYAAGNDTGEPSMGPHCSECYQRMHCPEYLLPVALGDSPLAAIAAGGELTPDGLVRAIHFAKAAAELSESVMNWSKEYVRRGGTIAADGKRYLPTVCKGRVTLDRPALAKAVDLTQYEKRGPSYERWGWRK